MDCTFCSSSTSTLPYTPPCISTIAMIVRSTVSVSRSGLNNCANANAVACAMSSSSHHSRSVNSPLVAPICMLCSAISAVFTSPAPLLELSTCTLSCTSLAAGWPPAAACSPFVCTSPLSTSDINHTAASFAPIPLNCMEKSNTLPCFLQAKQLNVCLPICTPK